MAKLSLSLFTSEVLSEFMHFLVLDQSPENVSSGGLFARRVVVLVQIESVRVTLEVLMLNVDLLHSCVHLFIQLSLLFGVSGVKSLHLLK